MEQQDNEIMKLLFFMLQLEGGAYRVEWGITLEHHDAGLPQGCWEDNGCELKLHVPNEFSFDENLNYLAAASNECLFHTKDRRLYKAIPVEQETPVVEISADQDGAILIRFFGGYDPEGAEGPGRGRTLCQGLV